MSEKLVYAVVFKTEETTTTGGHIVQHSGCDIWLTKSLCDTDINQLNNLGMPYNEIGEVPETIKTFKNIDDARSFMENWKGNNFYIKNSGKFRILEVIAKFRQEFDGYEIIN